MTIILNKYIFNTFCFIYLLLNITTVIMFVLKIFLFTTLFIANSNKFCYLAPTGHVNCSLVLRQKTMSARYLSSKETDILVRKEISCTGHSFMIFSGDSWEWQIRVIVYSLFLMQMIWCWLSEHKTKYSGRIMDNF